MKRKEIKTHKQYKKRNIELEDEEDLIFDDVDEDIEPTDEDAFVEGDEFSEEENDFVDEFGELGIEDKKQTDGDIEKYGPYKKKKFVHDIPISSDSWKRPEVILDHGKQLRFFLLNIDYMNVGSKDTLTPVIHIHGVDANGSSVLARVYSFKPHFYIKWTTELSKKYGGVIEFKKWINAKVRDLKNEQEVNLIDYDPIIGIQMENLTDGWNFNKNKEKFLRLDVVIPSNVVMIRNILTENDILTYESNVLFVIRFMINRGIVGGSWINIDNWKLIEDDDKESSSQIEVVCDYNHVSGLDHNSNEWSSIPKIRTLSFDIECLGKNGHFPKAKSVNEDEEGDPVVLISNHIFEYGNPNPTKTVSFALSEHKGKMNGNSELYTFTSEKELLEAWIGFFVTVQPDLLTGYNYKMFDLDYLYVRCEELKIRAFKYMGRILSKTSIMRRKLSNENTNTSAKKKANSKKIIIKNTNTKTKKQNDTKKAPLLGEPNVLDNLKQTRLKFSEIGVSSFGDSAIESKKKEKSKWNKETKDMVMEGITQLDVIDFVKKEKPKIGSFSLNNVAKKLVKSEKADMHHSLMEELSKGTEEQLDVFVEYCEIDALLPYKIMTELCAIPNMVGLARVTGIPLSFVYDKGQSIRTFTKLLTQSKQKGFIFPTLTKNCIITNWAGAKVFDPKTGYYDDPVASMDFFSLYPTMMIVHNLCYTTHIPHDEVYKYNPNDYIKTPFGAYFFKKHVRNGLLPDILDSYLKEREIVKKQMAEEKDPSMKSVLNGRQNAIKISANSVYGFTGFMKGVLPMLDISASVTLFGQNYITKVQQKIEGTYNKNNGYKCDPLVLYGDTDSVMVQFPGLSVEEATKLADFIASDVSKDFVSPMKLQFEHIYNPFFSIAKKRYAAQKWKKNPIIPDPELTTKGLEVCRGDSLPYLVEIQKGVFDILLVKMTKTGVKEYVKNMIRELLLGKIDIHKLILSQSISKPIHTYGKSVHVEVARKWKFDKETAPRLGDRVYYTFIQKGENGSEEMKTTKMCEVAEDPLYIVQKGLTVNYKRIYTKKIKEALQRILVLLFGPEETEDLLKIDDNIKNKIDYDKGLHRYSNESKCIGCGCNIKKNEMLCNECLKEWDVHYNKVNKKYEETKSRIEYMNEKCKEHMGHFGVKAECANRDCPYGIFYERYTKKRDYDRISLTLEKMKRIEPKKEHDLIEIEDDLEVDPDSLDW